MSANQQQFYKFVDKYDQIYSSLTKWDHWQKLKKRIYDTPKKNKDDKYFREIEAIMEKQYILNKQNNTGQSLYNLIYEKGISKDLKNNSVIRSISFAQGGKVILDIQNPQGFDYFYRKYKYEQYKYPQLIQQNPPSTLQTNEKLMEILCQEGQVSTETTFSPLYSSESNFYLAVSIIFGLKFLYIVLI